jgi:hypothetical protein
LLTSKFKREFDSTIQGVVGGDTRPECITYHDLREFAISFGLMSWSEGQSKTEEYHLMHDIWKILVRDLPY